MFVEERQALILEELNNKGRVRVKDLSERFQVTEDLIRKDLSVLEKAGSLKKIYGGAIQIKENVQRKVASQRKNLNLESKKRIAQKAYSLIQDGEVIFLDISTTSIEIAKLIIHKDISITVVTNMLEVINILVNSHVNAIFAGGELDYGRDGFVGSLTNSFLKQFYFDKAFMGVVGVDADANSVFTYMANDGQTKKMVLSNSKEAYMLCEQEKLNQTGNYIYAEVTDFTGIILDDTLNASRSEKLSDFNLNIL